MKRYVYATCCVESDGPSITEMVDIARDVTGETFRRRTHWRPWAARMGYQIGPQQRGLHLREDWHVSYYRSRYRGESCYYARHSAIEYIFLPPD